MTDAHKCSFCGKTQGEVDKLVVKGRQLGRELQRVR
jgi:hypothetical protein